MADDGPVRALLPSRDDVQIDRQSGMVTAELAVAMPAVVVALAAVLAVGQAALAQVRCVDAARAGARSAALGMVDSSVRGLAVDGLPGATVVVERDGGQVTVRVSRELSLLLPRGPRVTVQARAVALAEPTTAAAAQPWA